LPDRGKKRSHAPFSFFLRQFVHLRSHFIQDRSTIPQGESMSTPVPKSDPQALSAEYHKAHKQLMLWSAILLIWELVGVDLAKAESAGGNIGAIVTAIKSPQAIPWVLLILVAYFLFKVTMEWYQCNEERRRMLVARVDFVSAWLVALLAYGVYAGQAIIRAQFADLIASSYKLQDFLLGIIIGACLIAMSMGRVLPRFVVPIAAGLGIPLLILGLVKIKHDWYWVLGVAVDAVLFAAFRFSYRLYKRPKRTAAEG
jgi:hypothetical protein